MKKNNFLALSFMAACLMLIVSCQDNELAKNRYNDGKLHFKFAFNDKDGQWNEDGTAKRKTRIMTPVELTMPDNGTQPLYLHCIESEEIVTNEALPETTVNTRGQRLTGKVLEEGKIKTLGLYGRVGADYASGEQVLGANGVEIEQATLEEDGVWYVATPDFEYADSENKWTDAKKGYFYGFAPFPGSGEGQTKCITLGKGTDDKPLLNFTMQAEEKDNVDVLTACTENVTHSVMESQGIELTFRHVLSALKFKMKDDAKDLTVTIGGTDYYIQMKAVRIEGIYSKGTLPIASTASGSTTTWNRDDANTIGACEIKTADMRSRNDIKNDADHFINTDEHCLMVMPQAVPDDARLVLVCDLTTDEAGTTMFKENVAYYASLKGKTWLPGNSYTYTFSKYSSYTDYTFSSPDLATNTLTFPAEGGTELFEITSVATTAASNGTTSTSDEEWHVEYWDEATSTWKKGLPGGYGLTEPAGAHNQIKDLAHIPGGTAQTWGLQAGKRVDGSTGVQTMRAKRYPATGTDYYDLSTEYGSRNTANCYIIDGYGKFKLPLVYGNAILNGATNSSAYTETPQTQGTNKGATLNVFYNYKDNHISSPYIKDDTGVSLDDMTADIVWMDETSLLDYSSMTILKEDHGYLAFEVDYDCVRPGNAVVAVKDGNGDIMWSWHLWFTNLPVKKEDAITGITQGGYTFGLMQYHIGRRLEELEVVNPGDLTYKIRAVQNATGKEIQTSTVTQSSGSTRIQASNLYFQFGRKDPVPGLYADPTSSTLKVIRMETDIEKLGYEYTRQSSATLQTMGYAIQHPNMYIQGASQGWMLPNGQSPTTASATLQQWLYDYAMACWNPAWRLSNTSNYDKPIKSIYDPCPYGYVVPSDLARDWSGAQSVSLDIGESEYNEKINGNKMYIYTYSGTYSGKQVQFPLTGRRKVDGLADNFNKYGYSWTSRVPLNSSNVNSFGPLVGSYSSTSKKATIKNNKGSIAPGGALSVRPMVDRVGLGEVTP